MWQRPLHSLCLRVFQTFLQQMRGGHIPPHTPLSRPSAPRKMQSWIRGWVRYIPGYIPKISIGDSPHLPIHPWSRAAIEYKGPKGCDVSHSRDFWGNFTLYSLLLSWIMKFILSLWNVWLNACDLFLAIFQSACYTFDFAIGYNITLYIVLMFIFNIQEYKIEIKGYVGNPKM